MDFQQTQQQMNANTLQPLEQMRKKIAVKVFLWLLVVGAVFILGMVALTIGGVYLYNLTSTDKGTDLILVMGVFWAVFLFMAVFYFIRYKNAVQKHFLLDSEYGEQYRKEVVAKSVSELGGGLTYNPENGISMIDFSNSGFPMFAKPDRYASYGAIKGQIGKTDFIFSEVLAESITEDGHNNRQYTELFRGVFFIADLRKQISSATIIYPDAMKYFKRLLFPNYGNGGFKKVGLEDVRFEKYFEVFGTDQVEARYLLSPALMSRIVGFKQKTKMQMQFSFIGNKVYFGLFYSAGKGLYKPPLFTSVYNQKPLRNYIASLKFMIDIVKELNVNSYLVNG